MDTLRNLKFQKAVTATKKFHGTIVLIPRYMKATLQHKFADEEEEKVNVFVEAPLLSSSISIVVFLDCF